jgi:hypothetical protein
VEKNIALYLNAVFSPAELSLREQSGSYLAHAIQVLEAHPLPARSGGATSPVNLSINAYIDFIKLLKGWLKEKENAPTETETQYTQIDTIFIQEDIEHWSIDEIKVKLEAFSLVDGQGYIDKETVLLNRISNLFLATPKGQLSEVIMCYFELYAKSKTIELQEPQAKAQAIANLIEHHEKRSAILLLMSKASPLKLAEGFISMNSEQLKEQLQQLFP